MKKEFKLSNFIDNSNGKIEKFRIKEFFRREHLLIEMLLLRKITTKEFFRRRHALIGDELI